MSNKNKTILIWGLLSGLLLAMAATVAWKYKQQRMSTIIATAELASNCDPNSASCRITIPGHGEVSLSINPKPVPLVKDLTIDVNTKGLEVETITVDFKGVGMNMGINQSILERSGQDSYQGKGLLPVCIRGRMDWIANVMIRTNDGTLVAPFPLTTIRRQ